MRLRPIVALCAAALASSCGPAASKTTRSDCSCALSCGASQLLSRLAVCGDASKAVADAKASCEVHAPCTGATCDCKCAELASGDMAACAASDGCGANNGGCSENSTCGAFAGGVTCTCKAGFSSNAGICTDVDECTTGAAHCAANATCTNTPGSFTCACPAGYSGDGTTCTDVDECSTGPAGCGANAICTNTIGGFTCACSPGLAGDGGTCVSTIPPTGLTTCYGGCTGTVGTPACAATPFCGQDAQYPARTRTMSARTVGSETAIDDSRTGLSWMKSYLGPMSAQTGITTCAGLTFAGVGGWRLPAAFELNGLFDFRPAPPLIDPQFDLPSSMPFYFFSSSTLPLGCGASTGFGAAGFDRLDTGGACSPLISYRIRCVRGPAWNPDVANRFTTLMRGGAPVIVDSLTALEWQGGPSYAATATTTWADMLAYCEGSTYGGITDWRLPDFMEAHTVVLKHNALGETGFTGTYITSSYVGASVATVRLYDGLTHGSVPPTGPVVSSVTPMVQARCVRGGGR